MEETKVRDYLDDFLGRAGISAAVRVDELSAVVKLLAKHDLGRELAETLGAVVEDMPDGITAHCNGLLLLTTTTVLRGDTTALDERQAQHEQDKSRVRELALAFDEAEPDSKEMGAFERQFHEESPGVK